MNAIKNSVRFGSRRLLWACAAAVMVGSLAACANDPSREQKGQVIGGLVGGVVGSQFGDGSGKTATTLLGVLAGAAVGGAIGRDMDEQDRRRTAFVLEKVPTGETAHWVNPDTGRAYRVTPTRTFHTDSGPCREYRVQAVDRPDGELRALPATTACRQADGNWKVLN